MRDIKNIKNLIKFLKEDFTSDKERLKYILDNKFLLNKLGMQIGIDNDSISLYFGEDSDKKTLVFTFDSYGYELLNILFQSMGFDSYLV